MMSLVIDYFVQVFPFKSQNNCSRFTVYFTNLLFSFYSKWYSIPNCLVDPFRLTDKHQLPGSDLNTIVFIRKLCLSLIEIYFPLWWTQEKGLIVGKYESKNRFSHTQLSQGYIYMGAEHWMVTMHRNINQPHLYTICRVYGVHGMEAWLPLQLDLFSLGVNSMLHVILTILCCWNVKLPSIYCKLTLFGVVYNAQGQYDSHEMRNYMESKIIKWQQS